MGRAGEIAAIPQPAVAYEADRTAKHSDGHKRAIASRYPDPDSATPNGYSNPDAYA